MIVETRQIGITEVPVEIKQSKILKLRKYDDFSKLGLISCYKKSILCFTNLALTRQDIKNIAKPCKIINPRTAFWLILIVSWKTMTVRIVSLKTFL